MHDKPTNEDPVYEFSNVNAAPTAKKENDETYQLVKKDSKPTYMELRGTSGRRSDDDVDEEGFKNPTYQKLDEKSRESRLSDVGSVAMETQYVNLGNAKKTESVYQPLEKESVTQKKSLEEGKNESRSAYQSLNRPNSDNSHVKYNPGYEPESPLLYENSTSDTRDTSKKDGSTENYYNDNLYLELISNANQPCNLAESDDQPYEILPPTVNDNGPIYDNL